MANIKISELNLGTSIDSADIIPFVDISANETKKITKRALVEEIYNTTEVKTNKKWINGKPIYRKVINTGAMSSNSYVSIPHGISYLEDIVSIDGIAKSSGEGMVTIWLKFPYYADRKSDGSLQVQVDYSNVDIRNMDNEDYSWITQSYIFLEYTKTTDSIEMLIPIE